MTEDQLAGIVRAAIVGVGHPVDQIELVRGDEDQSLMAYVYADDAPDGIVHVFLIPDEVAAQVV